MKRVAGAVSPRGCGGFGDPALQARSSPRRFFEREADSIEHGGPLGGKKKEIAAELVLSNAEDVGRRLAHGKQAGEVRGEFVDAVKVEVELDEAGQRGLVERIGGNGADQGLAGVFGGVDVDEALRDGEEIFSAKGGLVEVAGEQQARVIGVAQPEVGDGLEAAEHGAK